MIGDIEPQLEPLTSYDKEEWWIIMQIAVPGLDRDEFNDFWRRFLAAKCKRTLH